MGIPKFFRYISERYPLTSQLIEENKIPEFDNLYLDFNGIIHNCSHPNDDDPHFRLSEEQIFTSIFAYVDLLFGKIKPKRLFFMAVDGVAPRAKMNQQRSRRFRTAKEVKELREKAERKGETLPVEKAFDSNCITPGTPFMTRLSNQLRYFINKKISEDSNWAKVTVVLSGHEVPGEGEHKIMEYIRLARAQPDYNPNVRHCLYGLDADLIMLGLLSHDPHFCLLREEVKFGGGGGGKGGKGKGPSLEAQTFYLLHLCLLREYLDLEFQSIAPNLHFPYSLERVIDDFIVLAVFVGNDFLPNLPDLHIHENGLERLFEVYKRVIVNMDGYINEAGTINTRRLQQVLDEMAIWEREVFEREYADANWYKGKMRKHVEGRATAEARVRTGLVLAKPQREIFDRVKAFVLAHRPSPSPSSSPSKQKLMMKNDFSARERKFISTLGEDLHLSVRWDEFAVLPEGGDEEEEEVNVVTLRFPGDEEEVDNKDGGGVKDDNGDTNGEVPITTLNGNDDEWVDEDEDDEEEDEESQAAVDRVLKKYETAKVFDDDGGFDERHDRNVEEKMAEWKGVYYKGKLGIAYSDKQGMGDLVYRYVEGLQWVMHYYYSGVASWGWFYNYHYAPRISDLKGLENLEFKFELGTPFKPFEQLMGVLPFASREHIPLAYQDLMYDSNSPILNFYPLEFEQDLNGKKQDWEAIVKIPFIDEEKLLKAMSAREHRLTPEEKARNSFGTSTKFSLSTGEPTVYPSSLPGFFPALHRCTCVMEPFDLPTLTGLHLIPGLCDGVLTGADALAGFPSLQTLPHTAMLGHHGVNVHGQESRNKSMVVMIQNPYEGTKTEEVGRRMCGERAFVGWPFVTEGLVVAVSDELFKYEKMRIVPTAPERVVANPHGGQGLAHWKHKSERIETVYSKRFGVLTGMVEVLLHVRPLKGMKRLETGALVKDYEGPEKEVEHAVQMCLLEVSSEDPRYLEKAAPPLSEEFPEGSKIFFLGEHAYGVAAQVSATTEKSLSVVLAFFPSDKKENEKFRAVVDDRKSGTYLPSFKAAETVGISSRALSKITSSFMVIMGDGAKINLGLSLKFEAKSLKVIDYSRKEGRHWEFSMKAIELIREYKAAFPEIFNKLDGNGDAMAKASEVLGSDPETRVKEVKNWLKSKGVRDFEPVSLFCDQLAKETVAEIEKLADGFAAGRSSSTIKKAIVKGIPRQAVLKPAHAVYRLQNQSFALGDRVTMVQDSGGVPLSAKGVVIGLNSKSMDVVWDNPFMSGVTLGDRCSQYRGSTVEFNTCLNLTNPQFVTSTNPKAPFVSPANPPFNPRFGPHPAVRPTPGQAAVSGFRPANSQTPVHIMANPNRGRGAFVNGRGGPHNHIQYRHFAPAAATGGNSPVVAENEPQERSAPAQTNGVHPATHVPAAAGRGFPRGGRGGFIPGFRGRGGIGSGFEGSRGIPHQGRGFRGRGRGRGAFVPS